MFYELKLVEGKKFENLLNTNKFEFSFAFCFYLE